MLNKVFVEFLYEAAHIQRWNDHIRPNGFTELDKQAHKMMILYVLAKYEEQDHQAKLNWRVLIEGGIFEFLHRIVLTDIKPPVFHELMRVHGKKLNSWVYEELRQRILDSFQRLPNGANAAWYELTACRHEGVAAAKAVGKIKEQCPLPLVVDIHFDYKLALEAIAAGADKVRINPGNIGSEDRVKAVADACRQKNIPIRIGVNGGSLEKPLLAKYGGVCPEAMVESAFGHIRLLNKFDFDDILSLIHI